MSFFTARDFERFWGQVSLPDESGCMLWTGNQNPKGYGRVYVGRKHRRAHRLSLQLAEGAPVDDRLHAAHSCRNRHCVAPDHLRWATIFENAADKVVQGVLVAGEVHPKAVLTNEQAQEIRRRRAEGVPALELASEYGVAKTVVVKILSGKTYRVALPKVGAR